jgi:seryl-tRNA synthetase
MLDITFIRENPDIVRAAIANKKTEPVDLDALLKLADERKALAGQVAELNRKRKEAADARDAQAGKKLKSELAALEERHAAVEKELLALLTKIPNVPSADTPVGDESANKVVRSWGEPPKLDFKPLPHWELGKTLGIIDSEKAAEVSGARFTYLKGDLALMQFALLQFAFKTLGDVPTLEDIARKAGADVTPTPFVPVVPPVMMRTSVMHRMARLHPMDERYVFEKDDIVLVGSAEHTIGPLHMDEILEESRLPIRYVGYSTAFRREAGAAGKDTRGILRQHQFDKIELETFVLPERSMDEQNFIVGIQEHLMQALKLPYQVVLKSTGDQGAPNHRGIDIETWMPGQDAYRETHTSDLMTSYQSRRLNTRVRRADGTIEHLHMNDATVFAIGRTLIAILENYQQADGSVAVPEVLRPFMGGKEKIEKVTV